jgi:murein DD-endopeptidase MepM/ murein hydrolase activator NlpD
MSNVTEPIQRVRAITVVFAAGILGSCAFVEVPAKGNRAGTGADEQTIARTIGQPAPKPQLERQTSSPQPVDVSVLEPPSATAAKNVVVKPGDTVYGVARREGVSPETIIRANNLTAPYTLAVGQRLRILKPTVHVVRPGETLYRISRQHDVDVYALASSNGLSQPYQLIVGQTLSIPHEDIGALAESELPPTAAAAPINRPVKALPKPPPASRGGFLWPVRGELLSRFGPKTSGLHNDGINIAASRGTAIKASQSGVVVYAGNQLQGFGNMLLLKHASGWITAYAHADALLVERGDKVDRGQTIASVGSTGGVNESQLHFEIRKGKNAVDPMRYLPPLGS